MNLPEQSVRYWSESASRDDNGEYVKALADGNGLAPRLNCVRHAKKSANQMPSRDVNSAAGRRRRGRTDCQFAAGARSEVAREWG